MVIDIDVFRSAIDTLKDRAATNDEKEVLVALKNILDKRTGRYDFVDLEDQAQYEVCLNWQGVNDVLQYIEQYYDDEEIFAGQEQREKYAKEICDRIDWDEFSYVLNCKGADMICEAIDDFLHSKEGA